MSEGAAIMLSPIGHVESHFEESAPVEEMRQYPSRLVVRQDLVAGLDGLAEGDRVLVLYHFDRADGYLLRRHPRGDVSRPVRGVFALRSQYRPNPIGATVVRIESIEDNVLYVTGLDALNCTPLLDIKPYEEVFDAPGEAEPAIP
ncbi:MAG TPA: tRNA (N6-threonylcarbamoyladenosine(37)-N6)-methyltransferase TrmO [Anaerolineae bacterium]|nr:tRNA (N6-threonylcarbamoyladenosine(37)-N6)-methyltransferase TrmO [Anaerolineae bacterium]